MESVTTVLQVRNSIAFGGVETTMLGWLNHIDKDRFNCPIALFQEKDGLEIALRKPLEDHNHKIIDLPWWPGRRFFEAVDRLTRYVRDNDVQLLHTHDWRSDVVGYFAAKKAGIPIMTTIYVWFKRPFHIFVKELIDSIFIRRFDLVTAVCDATRQQSVKRGVSREKTRVLLSGISEDRAAGEVDCKEIRSQYGIADDEICFVFVARFYPEKLHDCLIEAFAQARKQNDKVRLMLLGSGPLEQPIKAKASKLGLQDSVIFPGFVTNVPEILKSVDCMVHASRAEGIPLAVYEGMLSGLPVIGSDVDGTAEVVIPEKTGWKVPPNDPTSLARALVDAAGNENLRNIYGKQARDLITSEYSMQKAVRALEDTYLELIERNRTRK